MTNNKQNRNGLPDALLDEKRFFPLPSDRKDILPNNWNDPDNWQYIDDIPEDSFFGFAIGNNSDYLFIDCDHVRNPENGYVKKWVVDVIKRITAHAATYTEISMSETGLHLICDLGEYADNFARESNGYNQIIVAMSPVEYAKLSKDEQAKIPKIEFFYHTNGRYAYLTGKHKELYQIAKDEDAASIFKELLAVREEFHAKYAPKLPADINTTFEIDDVTRQRVNDALPYISATSRETWVTVGLALHNIGYPFEVWDEWSKFADQRAGVICDKYDPGETPKIWKSFKNTFSRWNAGTIIRLAKENGYSFSDDSKKRKSKVPTLEIVSAKGLVNTTLPEIYYPVDGLICEGLNVVGAPPKSGKSWMMLDMCLSVASGKKFLDFKTNRSDVVYFALEDGEKFEQERLNKLCNPANVPANFHFVFRGVVPLDAGFIDQLEQVRETYPKLKLVIIDTLRFVASNLRRGESAYEKDYRTGQMLKQWGDKYGIAVVVVTHTTKLEHPGDALANISGTSAVIGASDAVLVIVKEKRADRRAILAVDGRRVRQAEHEIFMNWDKCRWEYIGLADPETRERQQREREIEELRQSEAYKAVLFLAEHDVNGWYGKARKLIDDASEHGFFITDTPKEVGGMLSNSIALFARDGVKVQIIKNGTSGNFYKLTTWELQKNKK